MFPLTLLPLSLLPLAQSGPSHHLPRNARHPHPHNPSNPHRQLLRRSITADASSVSGASFDFIITGGGCAGLALGARLSEWSNVTVLVVEAGGDGSEFDNRIDIPGYSYLNSLSGTDYDWAYKTTAQVDAQDTVKAWPRGKGLGGSGAINGLFWGRGGSEDYDAWAKLNPDGEQTWNWKEMDKYINKAENFSQPSAAVQAEFGMVLDASAHGSGGPIQAGFSEYIFDGVKNWIPAWVNLGFTARDLAGGTTNGAMLSTSTLNMRNQTRSDSKAGYIDPLPPRSNLVILTGQQVTEVIFNGSTDASGNVIASGVTIQAAAGSTSYSVQANKEVILAGGTVGSPQLLQLSGIGPKTALEALGITSRLDLPVGYNLQDHISYSMYWSTPPGTLTWANLSNSDALQAEQLAQYEADQTGMWTYINEAVGYVTLKDLMSSAESSNYASTVLSALSNTHDQVTGWLSLPSTVSAGLLAQYTVQQEQLTTDVGQLEIILTMLGNAGNNNEVGIQVALQHPWSRGTILIDSTDPFNPPVINPDYFGVGYDIDIMSYGSAFARKLAATAPLSDLMIAETLPGEGVTGDALNDYTKTHSGTEYHPLGTCAMMPQANGGVVDTNLIVYGTANLRVIDASIMPLQISAHLMASTYGIAEKGADLIKNKYMAVLEANATSESGDASDSTASAGRATDSSVTNANLNGSSSDGVLATGAKIGIGVGAGVGALAVLAVLLFFIRRRKNKNGGEKGWYAQGATADEDASGAHKETSYPLSNFQPPNAPYNDDGYGHSRQASHSSVDTTAMASRTPMRSESGYGLARDGAYRDDLISGADYPRHQTYRPVKL